MNILHLLSQFEVTGAEVYAATLVNEQIRHNHGVTVVSDTFSTPVTAPYLKMPIGNRAYLRRFSNIRALVRLVRERQIDLIHAHSRAASWVAYVAARLTRTAFVSTVHGRQHVHASSKSFSIYGNNIIAVSESIKEHLVEELGVREDHITIIPNGLVSEFWQGSGRKRSQRRLFPVPARTKVILFVGRLSGPKGDVARFLASEIMYRIVHKCRCVLFIIGGELKEGGLRRFIDAINGSLGMTAVRTLDFQNDPGPYMKKADVVIGSGRVAVEALALGRPTIAFGESQYVGRITTANIAEAKRSNFGDTGFPVPVDPAVVAEELLSALRLKPTVEQVESLQAFTKAHFDIAVVEPLVESVYERAWLRIHSPDRIPILMYHRVVANPDLHSKHGIWVTKASFEQQLHSLRNRGFTAITFRQYDEFRKGKLPLPAKPIILTFDDGYEDNYLNGFPLLRKYGMPAVIFTVADLKQRTNRWDVDEPRTPLLSLGQMKEMTKEGIEFGSHTVNHINLTQVSPLKALREIARSKEILEDSLGTAVVSFAYPYGMFLENHKQLVEQAGYRYAVAGDTGPVELWRDFYSVRRTQVFPWTSAFGFWKKTQPWYASYKKRKQ